MTGNSINRRLLVIEDDPAIHDDFKKILRGDSATDELAVVEEALFGDETIDCAPQIFELDSADQGQSGLAMVEGAPKQGHPYAMAKVWWPRFPPC